MFCLYFFFFQIFSSIQKTICDPGQKVFFKKKKEIFKGYVSFYKD